MTGHRWRTGCERTGVPNGAISGGEAKLHVDNDPTPGGSTPTLTNNGTIDAETDPGISFGEFIQAPANNAGSLTNASSTLTLQDGNLTSSNSGTMTIASGAATILTGGPGFTNSGQITATKSLTLTSLNPQTWTESGGSVTMSMVSLYDGDTLTATIARSMPVDALADLIAVELSLDARHPTPTR
ncbi:MAG TPA: hypothetical protein VHV75_10550 [Solirubrobacteraceae bacterium]|jgi:hypothetical protein|nr:hypothetical protein [Solirubrobacteraceae bacterium]